MKRAAVVAAVCIAVWLAMAGWTSSSLLAGAGSAPENAAPGVPGAAGAVDATAARQSEVPEPVAAAATAPTEPTKVATGIFVNDIQDIDFKTNSFSADFYVWFRWKDGELDPSKSMEFMNRFQPNEHLRESLIETPKEMPDGARYAIIRAQGRFSTKFELEKYPFDEQRLAIVFEDTMSGDSRQVYVADKPAVTLNPSIMLPGFRIGRPALTMTENLYPTNFGDQTVAEQEAYSRATVTLPITRPLGALSLKTFVPVLLIIFCSGLALFIRPQHVDGRIGLSITALLTLVALQLTAGSALPDVDYLTMLDKVYLASYAFILLVLSRVVATSWSVADEREGRVAGADRRMAFLLAFLYLSTLAGIAAESLLEL